ncbi:hypothetical protein Tco_0060664 [Tanacetum coccineum]
MSTEINKKKELQYLEQVAKLSTYATEPSQHFNCTCCDDDDYEESTIPLNEIDSQTPTSIEIIPVLPTLEPKDSLIMGNEELSTILEKESDVFIKSSVEELVLIPSESGDTVESDSDCNLTSCADFSPINVYKEQSVTFSNPLFDSNDDFTSSDDESLSDEDDECFTPSDDVELLLHHDSSTPMISVVSILEGFTNESPLEENDDLFDLESKKNKWKKILYDDPIDDLISTQRDIVDRSIGIEEFRLCLPVHEVIEQPMARSCYKDMSTPDYIFPIIVPSDSNDDLSKYLLASLAISPFHDDPYMKVMKAYNATSNELPIPLPQAPIAPPTILPPSPIEESSHKTHLERHEEQIETILNHLDELPGNGYCTKRQKNEAKQTKPGTGMERVQEIEAKGKFIQNPIPLNLYPKRNPKTIALLVLIELHR